MGFTSVQTIVALIAKSEAMMGDSAAMAVDALTYGFNLYAERKKNEDNEINRGSNVSESGIELSAGAAALGDETNNITTHEAEKMRLERHLQSRRRHLHLELVPPLMSVSILLVVISFVLRKSIHTLVLDAHRNEREQSRPNLVLMMTFSTLNLLLDVVNVTCFARAKHLMGYNTEEKKEGEEVQEYDFVDNNDDSMGHNGVHYEIHDAMPGGSGSDECRNENFPDNTTTNDPIGSEENDEDNGVNLNMCSAYTHVFADTLRSIAVVIASIIAEVVDSVTPEVADATAAVIVSVIILLSLFPLFRGLFHTWCELRLINREEQSLSDNEPNDPEGEIT
ncbi:hypothetical protein ACHAXR_001958 [Thalassiosira sp. AJA248-18]